MAITGISNFSVTRDDIIKGALRLLKVIDPESGQGPTSTMITNASESLNIMIKSLVTEGLPLWVYQYMQIPLVEGINKYPIGSTAGYIGRVDITNGGTGYPASGTVTFTGGTLGSAATGTYASTAGVITSITITASGNSYTSAPAVSFSGGGSGAAATARIVGLTDIRPLRIIEAFVRDSNNRDIPQIGLSRQEYNVLGIKTTQTVTNQYFYDPQLDLGQLYVFPVPNDSTKTFFASAQKQFSDMNAAGDTFDFPQEFFNVLKWGLAFELSSEYEVDLQRIMFIKTVFDEKKDDSFNFNVEQPSVYFSTDPRMRLIA